MFKRALLTLDRSPYSEAAIPYVANLNVEDVLVLEVIESVPLLLSRYGPAFDVPKEDADRIVAVEREAAEEHLAGAVQRLEEAGVANVQTSVRHGNPADEIVKAVAEEGCDVVVMSTHGRSGVRRALLGSVANQVVHDLHDAAVLLVRPPAD